MRRGYRPSKIAFLAWHAWRDVAAGEWPPGFPETPTSPTTWPTVRRWLEVFVERFFANQFKRGAAQRAQGQRRRHDEPARRLADAAATRRAAAWLAELERVPDTH